MEISEERLRELVIKAIELFQSEHSKEKIVVPKKKLYVILTEKWNVKYWNFFLEINRHEEYNIYVIISDKVDKTLHLSNLKKFKTCKKVIDEKDIDYHKLDEYITVFPMISRSAIVKAALCIDDIFETKWIFKAMEKGQRIVLLSSGLEKFTGKEPFTYVEKILNYYRNLLEFDIEIVSDINKYNWQLNEKNDNYLNNNLTITKGNIYDKKKVITSNDIEKYSFNNKIILNHGDIITDMAEEKAKSLNILIVR